MNFQLKSLFSFTVMCLLHQLTYSQYILDWNKTINDTRGQFIRTDAANNVFTGGRVDVNTNSWGMFLNKMDSAGNPVWYLPLGYGKSAMSDILIDDSSNIYISGTAEIYIDPSTESGAALTAKYDSA